MSARFGLARARARELDAASETFPISNGEPFGTMKSSAPALARCAVMAGVQMSSQTGTPIVHSAKVDRLGQRPRREHALLVEDAVVREVGLEPPRRRAACRSESPRCRRAPSSRHGVVATSAGAVLALADQAIDGRVARVDDRRAQHEIFRRISDDVRAPAARPDRRRQPPARSRARRMRARLPSMSPTVGLSCASAMVRCTENHDLACT